MRDPATRIDPDVEAAIEDTRRYLEGRVTRSNWKADPPPLAGDWRVAIDVIRSSPRLTQRQKLCVYDALFKAMRKRSSKPTRNIRDIFLAIAAGRLAPRYRPSRNDETRDRESAGSIIREALKRLGVRMTERQIKDIVLKYPAD